MIIHTICLAALATTSLAAPVSVRNPPNIPDSWTAHVKTSDDRKVCQFSEDPNNCGLWQYSQDDHSKLFGVSLAFKNRFAPSAFEGTGLEFTNVSYLATATEGAFINQTGICYADPSAKYDNMFGWVSLAMYAGQSSACDECELWELSTRDVNLSVVTKGDAPVLFNISKLEQGKLEVEGYHFFDFAEGADPGLPTMVDKGVCTNPPVCQPPTPVVPVNASMFIFHPAAEFNISGQDTGDMAGDTFFMCEDLITGRDPTTDHNYAWLTHWTVEHYPQYGQYQNCNGYPSVCKGSSDWLVGREAAVGLGAPLAGQCTSHELTGTWWSLPVRGRCDHPGAVLGKDCTWRETRVKTINGTCLIHTHGLEAKCRADGTAPFKQATEVFSKAFASDDVALGGCPPISV